MLENRYLRAFEYLLMALGVLKIGDVLDGWLLRWQVAIARRNAKKAQRARETDGDGAA
jgi:hypothetical protein